MNSTRNGIGNYRRTKNVNFPAAAPFAEQYGPANAWGIFQHRLWLRQTGQITGGQFQRLSMGLSAD